MNSFLSRIEARMTTNKWNLTKGVFPHVSIIVVAAVTYLPAVDNFFISDDFTMLSYLEALKQNPTSILQDPSELFRLMSYLYFGLCSTVFGVNAEGYYWAGIALHALASLLVFALVLKTTATPMAAWAAGLFFAAYERHQEAIMWISAANDLILTIFCIVFILLWSGNTRLSHAAAVIIFVVALFSKEPAVALLPLAVLLRIFKGFSWRDALVQSTPLALLTAAYACLWLSRARNNFFITDHHYALGFQFFPVYVQTLVRMVLPTALFMVPIFALGKKEWIQTFARDKASVFFAGLLCFAVIPYSFLTYLPSIPSRNTYFPSVGLAALVGVAFATLYPALSSRRARGFAVAFFIVMVNQNIAYVWIKKEPQYMERAAPTRELIDVLNGIDGSVASDASICVMEFPLHPWIGEETVKRFTRFDKSHLTFAKGPCEGGANDVVLRWTGGNALTAEYEKKPGKIASAP
jgi:hypothetical protein